MPSYLYHESNYGLEEWDTKPCMHCRGAVKVYLPPYTHQCDDRCRQFGCDHEQFYCTRHQGVLCMYCGKLTWKLQTCNPTWEQIREERLRRLALQANRWQGARILTAPAPAEIKALPAPQGEKHGSSILRV